MANPMATLLARRRRNYDRAIVRASAAQAETGPPVGAATLRRLQPGAGGGIPGAKGLGLDPANIPPQVRQAALQRLAQSQAGPAATGGAQQAPSVMAPPTHDTNMSTEMKRRQELATHMTPVGARERERLTLMNQLAQQRLRRSRFRY